MELDPHTIARIRKVLDAPFQSFVALVDLSGVDRSTAFRGAKLPGVDLTNEDLRGFDFAGADLTGAVLIGADLSRTNGLDKAILRNVIADATTTWPYNFRIADQRADDSAHVLSAVANSKDENWFKRQEAAQSLGHHIEVQTARTALLRLLGDPSWSVRLYAIRSLAPLADDAQVRAALLEAENDSDSDVRRAAERALHPEKFAVEGKGGYLVLLNDSDWHLRLNSILALADHCDESGVRLALIKTLGDDETRVREMAAQVLGRHVHRPEISFALRRALNDKSAEVRQEVMRALVRASHRSQKYEPLLELLNSPYEDVCLGAAAALAPHVARHDVQDAFRRMLNSHLPFQNFTNRPDYNALNILISYRQDLSANRESFLLALLPAALASFVREQNISGQFVGWIDLFDEAKRSLLHQAVALLASSNLGENEVLTMLKSTHADSRAAAVRGLTAHLGDAATLARVTDMLNDADWRVRKEAINAVLNVCSGISALTNLKKFAQSQFADVRAFACDALAQDRENPRAQKILAASLSDPEAQVRLAALRALQNVAYERRLADAVKQRLEDGAEAERMLSVTLVASWLPYIETLAILQDAAVANSSPNIRKKALEVLADYGSIPEVRAYMCSALSDKTAFVRLTAVRSLSEFSGEADAFNALSKSLRDTDLQVRREASTALRSRISK